MAVSLSTPTFTPGTTIFSAEVIGNFNDLANYINGNINTDSFTVLSGQIIRNITTNIFAEDITSTSTEGIIFVNQTGLLAANKSSVLISSSLGQTTGDALLRVFSNAIGSTIPALQVENLGSGPTADFKSTSAGILPPRMTLVQRKAIATPVAGMKIFNTDHKREEVYDGDFWVSSSGDSGQIAEWPGAVIPPYAVLCDGSTLPGVDATDKYAKAKDVLGTTWGGAGVLPEDRGRTTVGAGAGPGLTVRTLGQLFGSEALDAHTHILNDLGHDHGGFVAATNTHTHTAGTYHAFLEIDATSDRIVANRSAIAAWTPAFEYTFSNFNTGASTGARVNAITVGGASGLPASTGTTLQPGTTGITVNSAGAGSSGNMQPSIVYNKIMIL